MRLLFLALGLVWGLTAPIAAQQVAITVDPAQLQMGYVDVRPVDADGNPATDEWLVYAPQTAQFRVIATQGARICSGETFTLTGVYAFQSEPFEVVRWGLRDVLKVKRPQWLFAYVFDFIALTRPEC